MAEAISSDFKMQMTRQVGGRCYVALHGEIDVAVAPLFKARMMELILAGQTQLVLNLDDLRFLDSVALGVLISLLRRVREKNGDIVLVCNNARIEKLFQVTGLYRAFTMLKTEDQVGMSHIPAPDPGPDVA